jgi:hypothetical protein
MTEAQWRDRFGAVSKPRLYNPVNKQDASFISRQDRCNIWSLVERQDGSRVLVEGVRWETAVSFIITIGRFMDGEKYEVVLDPGRPKVSHLSRGEAALAALSR